mgnify:CR=1 FL=1
MFKFLKKNKEIELTSPITGDIIPLEEVSDPVFAEKMMGDGIAIEPSEGKVLSPIDGKIATIFPTNHAIGLVNKEGLEILIHIGLDTVELKGDGFIRVAEEGQNVKKGDLLMEVDLEKLKESGKPTITPIIITNMDKVDKIEKNAGKVERGNSPIFTVNLK